MKKGLDVMISRAWGNGSDVIRSLGDGQKHEYTVAFRGGYDTGYEVWSDSADQCCTVVD